MHIFKKTYVSPKAGNIDMARTVVNLTGNALAAVVMSKWEGEYDAVKGQTVLNQREPADIEVSG